MAENYILLERTELNAAAASVTFANIPQTGYTDLKIVASIRGTDANNYVNNRITFNGSTSGYTSKLLYGLGSSTGSLNNSVTNAVDFSSYGTGSSATANTFGNTEIYIPNYTSSNNKSISVDAVSENNATTAIAALTAGLWSNSAAITSITITPAVGNIDANSTFSLYGIAALGTTPAIAPKADGGNVIATDGTYWYHAFLSSGNFVPQVGLTADVLVIAGGGGSGGVGGGGGAGGLLLHSSQLLANATNYACTVGAGGPGGLYSTAIKGTNGINSQFGSLTQSAGGGGGGTAQNANPGARVGLAGGSSGGSGGADNGNGTVSSQTPSPSGQGSAGGNGSSQTFGMGGGGGGGAGGAGAGGTYSSPATGGAGVSTYSSWGVATNTGQNISGTRWFAGGGGGYANYGNGGANPGGNGGGGDGDGNNPGLLAPGTANTGGGAGIKSTTGSAGGSGIIIVRYPIA
jgi:hypothetical protein